MKTNLEIKTPIEDYRRLKKQTEQLARQFKSAGYHKEKQKDIYYNIKNGRLKLRIINGKSGSLIYYNRSSRQTKRVSNYIISTTKEHKELNAIMKKLYGVKVIVDKTREIYVYDNIRIHLDRVKNLGNFLEFEVIFSNLDKAKQQLKYLLKYYKLNENQFIKVSYSDMLLKNIPSK
jgi:predicted adenylyl cyclase CyaB